MAGALIAPELVLTHDESKIYADAANEVASHYNNIIDAKTMAWINLSMCVSGLYGPRFYAIHLRKKYEKEETPRPNVVPIQPTTAAPVKPNGAAKPQTPSDVFGLGMNLHFGE
jgi:hypothetical protein